MSAHKGNAQGCGAGAVTARRSARSEKMLAEVCRIVGNVVDDNNDLATGAIDAVTETAVNAVTKAFVGMTRKVDAGQRIDLSPSMRTAAMGWEERGDVFKDTLLALAGLIGRNDRRRSACGMAHFKRP